MSDDTIPDYTSIDCPPSIAEATEPVSDWHYTKRRAFIHQMIVEYGTPEALPPQRELAERLSVSQGTVSKDIRKIARSAMREVDPDCAAWTITRTFRAALREQSRDGDWAAAVRTAEKYADWCETAGIIDTEPDRVNVTTTGPGDDEFADGFLSEQNKEHFKRLTRAAEKDPRNVACTVENPGDQHPDRNYTDPHDGNGGGECEQGRGPRSDGGTVRRERDGGPETATEAEIETDAGAGGGGDPAPARRDASAASATPTSTDSPAVRRLWRLRVSQIHDRVSALLRAATNAGAQPYGRRDRR